jgi:HK97 family phage prohead protease
VDDLRTAAQARAAGVTQRSHRPQQRQAADGGGRVAFRAALSLDDTDGLRFRGYATVYEAPYEMADLFGPYSEVVSAGAAADTLNRGDLDVPFVLGHDQLRRIARTTNGTLTLTEDETGLLVEATLDPADADVAYIAPKLRAGLIDEMSFAFRITSGLWSPDYSEYRIDRFDLHRGDVAIVGFGANPATAGSGLRTAPDLAHLRARLLLASAL